MTRSFATLDRTGKLYRAAEKQQFFGQRRLAGIGMGDDRKRTPPADFVNNIAHNLTCKRNAFYLIWRSRRAPTGLEVRLSALEFESEDQGVLTAVDAAVIRAPVSDLDETL